MSVALLLTFILGILLPLQVSANEVPDKGSITIRVNTGGSTTNSQTGFSVWRVDTSSGIPSSVAEGKNNRVLSSEITGQTNASGQVKFDNLVRGVYYVEQHTNSNDEGQVFASEPFLVSVPTTDPTGTGWVEDVVIDLKDVSLFIDKFVGPAGDADYDFSNVKNAKNRPVSADETFGWTIASFVPTSISSLRGSYVVEDDLSANFTFDKDSIKVYYVKNVQTPCASGVTLTKDTHYKLNITGNKIQVELTSQGLQLAGNSDNRFLLVKFDSKLSNTAAHGVNLYNGATVTYTKSTTRAGTFDSTKPSSAKVSYEPEVHQGMVQLQKLDDSDKQTPLSGAEFGIALTKEDAEKGNYVDTLSTDANGICEFKGLKYGAVGDEASENTAQTTFWVKEIKAPEGYKRLESPIEVQFAYEKAEGKDAYFAKLKVYNVKTSVVPGPGDDKVNTGDTTNMVGMALLLIASSIIVVLAVKKRKKIKE